MDDRTAAPAANVPHYATASFLLEGLTEIGIDYLFCNFGTDHAPIIEELARRRKNGQAVPKIVRCPHENTAAHMAAGFAAVTGRGQGVLVHVDVGTANTANAMHNMYRSRLPALLMSGKAPYTTHRELIGTRDTHVHFVQEPFDQGALVRPYVKWEWTLPSGVIVKETLRRAASVMQSEPRGPVYLMLQRETLTQHWRADEVASYPAAQFGPVAAGGADPKLLAALAERLLAAENPMLITAYAGRNPRTARAIAALAEFAGIAVYEAHPASNISHSSPCFSGFAPGRAVTVADVGILVDVDVPWFPADVRPVASSYWAHIDIDALKRDSPMWTLPADLRLQGDSGLMLEQLHDALAARVTPLFTAAAAARVKRLAAAAKQRLAEAARLAADHGEAGAINPHYLMAELGRVLDDEDIVFNEAVRNVGATMTQIPRPVANTLIDSGGAGLGWSGGMALGAKLAAPARMMVQLVGDGSFYFNVPTSVFAVAQQYRLPLLTIVLDNSGWQAVKQSTLRVFPDGEAKASNEFEAELASNVDYGRVAEAFGAYAEKVSDPASVPEAIARCAKIVRGGRSALLHVKITRL